MTADQQENATQLEVISSTSSHDHEVVKRSKSSTSKKVRQVMKMKTKKDRIRMAVAILVFLVVIALIVTGAVLGSKAAKDDGGGDEATTTTTTTVSPPPEIDEFRLPNTLKPLSYVVQLQPFINGNFSIAGYVLVEMQVVEATNNITLHMVDIITHNETVKVSTRNLTEGSEKDVAVSRHEYDPKNEWYVAHLEEEVQVDQLVVLSMDFTGLLNDQLKGFYRSSYTDPEGDTVWLAVSQFEADDARRAFPCMDEPGLKARFTISLARETNMTASSNMPLNATQPISDQEGWVWDHFQTTVPMSTYLVAFLVSDFGNLTDGNFSVWSRNEVLEQAERALQVGPEILQFYEEYFNLSYPLPKMDMVAIPDFAAGAMENWGLITYREEDMLLPEGSSAVQQQRMVVVVTHELAHQWFGNLVTPSWWTDIWLNEGFASYMENIGTNEVEPDWSVLQQMVLTMQDVMGPDSLASTHPVSQPVSHPDEIEQIFDDISYSKGMSVIRMMNHFLTESVFRKGLTNYLNYFAYDVATQDDLWSFLTEAATSEEGGLPTNTTVKDIMDTWTLQDGYPVVTVIRSGDGLSANVTQERFFLAGNSSVEEENSSWWVPLTYTSANATDFSETHPKLWIPAGTRMLEVNDLPSKEDWVLFNLQGTGYFRVNYDENNWAKLKEQLQGNLSVIEVTSRSQLLDDSLNLARAGRLDYSTVLGLIDYLGTEQEYVPWSSALSGLSYLEEMLTRTAAYGDLKRYLLGLLEPLYEDVGFEDNVNDPHLEQYKRSLAVSWACKLGHKECVTKAVQQFEAWLANGTNEIAPNIKSTVYCTGVAEGGQEEWEGTWGRYLETDAASERTNLLRALGCSKELWILANYLDMAFTEGSGIRKQDSNLVFNSVASNDVGRTLAWTFLRDEWNRIGAYYNSFDSVGSLITSVTAEFNTPIEKYELEVFSEEHEESLSSSTRAVQMALENVDANIAWMDNSYEIIKNWLAENAGTLEAEAAVKEEKEREEKLVKKVYAVW